MFMKFSCFPNICTELVQTFYVSLKPLNKITSTTDVFGSDSTKCFCYKKTERQLNECHVKVFFQKQLLLCSTIFTVTWTVISAFYFSKQVEIERHFIAVSKEIKRRDRFHSYLKEKQLITFFITHNSQQLYFSQT